MIMMMITERESSLSLKSVREFKQHGIACNKMHTCSGVINSVNGENDS